MLIVDPNEAVKKAELFKRELPDVALYYAYKCFSDEKIVAAIDTYIDGYDIASENECNELMKLGVSTERMYFANPVKVSAHVRNTYVSGVRTYMYQSADELKKIATFAPRAEVILRLKVDDSKNVSGQKFSYKFGADPVDAISLLEHARSLDLRPIGLTFHVGSQSTNPILWSDAIRLCGHIIAEAASKGIAISVLDIGGGFPVDYVHGTTTAFSKIARAIRCSLDTHIPSAVKIVAEPGRFIVASSACMVTSVIGREMRNGQEWLYLDAGIFQGFMEAFEFNRLLQAVIPLKESRERKTPFTLAGPSCDGDDIVASSVVLPNDIHTASRLIVAQAGAYTLSYATRFNGFSLPYCCYV